MQCRHLSWCVCCYGMLCRVERARLNVGLRSVLKDAHHPQVKRCHQQAAYAHAGLVLAQVPEERCLGDPPLLRLESEASHAYLSTLLDLRAGGPDADPRVPGIASQLTALCVANLQRFRRVSPTDGAAAAGATRPAHRPRQACLILLRPIG